MPAATSDVKAELIPMKPGMEAGVQGGRTLCSSRCPSRCIGPVPKTRSETCEPSCCSGPSAFRPCRCLRGILSERFPGSEKSTPYIVKCGWNALSKYASMWMPRGVHITIPSLPLMFEPVTDLSTWRSWVR